MQGFVLLLSFIAAHGARYNFAPQFNDSAIIVDTDKVLPQTFPYYQPIQSQPKYKISDSQSVSTIAASTNTADVFTQEEFPRELLEIAQQKLGLKSLDEVPSITELAELLGTNNAAETISYIRQLTSTAEGIDLMKAYIDSTDYTDNGGVIKNHISTTPMATTTPTPTKNVTQPGFWNQMLAYFNVYNVQPQHKQIMEQQFKKIATAPPQFKPNALKNMPPLYPRIPVPFHYPIPLPPMNANITALRRPNNRQIMMMHAVQRRPPAPPHLNTAKVLSASHIQQLARIANVSPKKLESFLKQKPKLAELAIKIISFPQGKERNPQADSQLLAAVRMVMEQDEDLKKLFAENTLM